MYPANFFGLFPAFPRENTVFVAMSFDKIFENRWNKVICRAIEQIQVNGISLRPIRVDERLIGDSILTEILSGISSSKLIFADISSIGCYKKRPVRNGNVMYEVGLAHSVRLPEEVVLFRSDQENLLFDTANIRVNTYSPDENPELACQKLIYALESALKEIDLRRHLAIKKAADSLDVESINILVSFENGKFIHPTKKTTGQALYAISIASSIQRLLDMGLIMVDFIVPETVEQLDTPVGNLLPYKRTTFGDAVFYEISLRLTNNGKLNHNIRDELIRIAKTKDDRAG
jgi:hypothetical protein